MIRWAWRGVSFVVPSSRALSLTPPLPPPSLQDQRRSTGPSRTRRPWLTMETTGSLNPSAASPPPQRPLRRRPGQPPSLPPPLIPGDPGATCLSAASPKSPVQASPPPSIIPAISRRRSPRCPPKCSFPGNRCESVASSLRGASPTMATCAFSMRYAPGGPRSQPPLIAGGLLDPASFAALFSPRQSLLHDPGPPRILVRCRGSLPSRPR